MKQVRFTVLGEPKGKGRPRFSMQTGHAYTPKDTVNYENLIKTQYQIQCGGYRFDDYAMLDMRIMAYYSVPKSDSKKKAAEKFANRIRPIKKIDVDNLVKVVADSLNQIAYRDDVQIVDLQCRKFYSAIPRIEVIIREVIPE